MDDVITNWQDKAYKLIVKRFENANNPDDWDTLGKGTDGNMFEFKKLIYK